MTLSKKKEYARSFCQELYNLIDAHHDITVRLTEALATFEMAFCQRILSINLRGRWFMGFMKEFDIVIKKQRRR